jgi:hypothetical protein
MAEVPHVWAAYARCQQQLSTRASLDDASWGLEAGLNAILAGKSESGGLADDEVVRTVANASRRNRHCAMLVKKYSTDLAGRENVTVIGEYEARSDLARLALKLSSQNYRLLLLIGYGEDRADIAMQFGMSPEGLRARISRARSEARGLLAA